MDLIGKETQLAVQSGQTVNLIKMDIQYLGQDSW